MHLTPQLAISWPSFLAPQWGWLGFLAVPIILLYILRQKRPDTPISSVLLWSKALSDMRASTPWQKLRRNLQLLLQLLILAAIVLTLMRPVMAGQASQTVASVIVIDATASMQTLDADPRSDDPNAVAVSRFDRAREEARKLVGAMRPGDKISIIVDGGGLSQSSSGFLTSKSDLLNFIDGLTADGRYPSDGTSDLSESLLTAVRSINAVGAAAESRTDAMTEGSVYLMSDGAGVVLPSGFKDKSIHYIQLGTRADNVGITQLTITPTKVPGKCLVFVEVYNASSEPHEIRLDLAMGSPENFKDTRKAVVQPKSSPAAGDALGSANPSESRERSGFKTVTFSSVDVTPGPIYVVLTDKQNKDDLPVDNVAYGVIEAPRKTRVVLVGAGGTYMDKRLSEFLLADALSTELDVSIVQAGKFDANVKADLFIFNGVLPPEGKLPKGDMLFIRPPGSVAGFVVNGVLNRPEVLRYQRNSPELSSVEVGEMRIFQALQIVQDGEATELVSTTNGPLIAYRDVGMSRRYILGFSPVRPDSDWIQYTSFPIFLVNILDAVRQRHFVGIPQIIPTGGMAKIADVVPGATVDTPFGSRPVQKDAKSNDGEFSETDKVGIYTVNNGGNKTHFAVNVLSKTETDVAPRALNLPEGGNVEGSRSIAQINREIWPIVAAVGLLILLAEWIVYHRRVG